jgi:subtilisin-like proprotein convertase family protein
MIASLGFSGSTDAIAQSYFLNETADGSADNVGFLCSLALDASGDPHVAYLDATTLDLKYAVKFRGIWTFEIADGATSSVGSFASLALDMNGNPHLSYLDATNFDLKYARKSSGSWTTETADGSPNILGQYTALALDAQGNPHVSYYDETNSDLKYARRSGGVWIVETAEASASDVGTYTSLALDSQGNPHVSYRDGTLNDLKYARKSGGSWANETADASANAVGQYTSIALSAQGEPHVSYRDGTTRDLRYARKIAGSWTIETADASSSFVGEHASLALDAQSNPHVSYYDATLSDLKYARKSGGSWTISILDASANVVGEYSSLALDTHGNPHVSYYDRTTEDLKYGTAAVRVLGPPVGATWAVGSRQRVSWAGIGPADILLSLDGGRTFDALAESITDNTLSIRVPHAPTRFARLRIRRSTPFSTSDTDSFFTINATIALAKFDAAREDTGTRLTWETQPGPEADIRYRVERGGDNATFVSIADALDRGDFLDPSPVASSRYRLIAINGLGEEYVLGETSVAGVLAAGRLLTITPNVSAGQETRVVFRANSDYLDTRVSIYDASGRTVKTLAGGVMAPGVQAVTWDGRDESGEQVAPGAYFARLSWGGTPRATERLTIVR